MHYNFRYSIFFPVLAISVLLMNPSQLFAQDEATLRILVISAEDGNAVIGANVLLLSHTEEEKREEIIQAGVTDSDGLQELRGVKPGKYRLEVSFVGHKTYRETLLLKEGERRVEQVTLPPDVEQLEEVIVSGEREITTGEAGVRRISNTDVDRIPTPAPGGDLASYLQTLPGITTGGDRGGDLYIRGGTPAQNRVLVDNLPVVKPFHISNLFSAFPEQTIQNVDLYAGGFGAEYMGATSAVIDVSLRPGNMREHSSSSSISPYLFSLHAEGPVEPDEQSFIFMGRKSVIEQSAPHITGEEVPMNFYDVTGRYSFRTGDYSCNVTGMRTYDSGQINPDRNIRLSWSNTALGARCLGYDERYDHPFEATIGYTGYQNAEGTADNTERSAGIHQIFFKFDQEDELLGLPVEYGGGLNFRFYSAELAERFTTHETFHTIDPIVHTYISTQWQPNEQVRIQPSFGSQVTLGTNPTLEPRLRMFYRPGGDSDRELSLALGKYYQIMDGISDERDAGTAFTVWRPNRKDEPLPSSRHGIVGYQQRIGNYFKANLEGYARDHSNFPVSEWTPVAQLEVETALANGSTYGFDIRIEYERNLFYFFAGYGWSKVTYEAATEDLGAWIEEPVFSYSPAHDQRHKFNALASLEIGGFTAGASWEYGSGKPYTRVYGFDLSLAVPHEHPTGDPGTARTLFSRPYGERLPPYHRMDISLERTFQLSPQLSLIAEAGMINLYNRSNIFYFDLNTLQRVDQTPLLPYISIRTEIQ